MSGQEIIATTPKKNEKPALKEAYTIFRESTKELIPADHTTHTVDYSTIYAHLPDGTSITVAAAREEDPSGHSHVRNINIGIKDGKGGFAQIFPDEPVRGEGKFGALLKQHPDLAKTLFNSISEMTDAPHTLVKVEDFNRAFKKVPVASLR